MRSAATTVEEYLQELPSDRGEVISAVREVLLAHLPTGIVETINWGMISYEVPLSTLPDTYNGQPLSFAGLASQRQHCSLYLMAVYGSRSVRQQFESDYALSGRRMDIGKSCVRFRSLDDLPLDAVARAVSAVTLEEFITMHEQGQSLRRSRTAQRRGQ